MLSIAIPTYRRPTYLRQALESIAREVDGISEQVEVVVSDNASGDDTEEISGSISGLPVAYFCNDDNLGAAENIILSCERCTGDYVFLLGDDDLVEPGTLERVISVAVWDRPPGVISGPVSHFQDGDKFQTGNLSFRNDLAADQVLSAGGPALEQVFLRATMVSGLTIRRDLLDADGARRHADSLYPQIYLAGSAALGAGVSYLNKPVVSVRAGPEAEWSYSGDYMTAGVFGILDELTAGLEWGPGVRKRITRRRVRATYSPLYNARKTSIRAYLKTVRGLSSVSQHRRSPIFWAMALAVGVLGTRGVSLVRNIVRRRAPDRIG